MKRTSSRQRLVSRQGIVLPAMRTWYNVFFKATLRHHVPILRYILKPTTFGSILYIVVYSYMDSWTVGGSEIFWSSLVH